MPDGRVRSVNIGAVAPLASDPSHRSGIDKTPRPGRVPLGVEGLEGDAQGNLEVHGGPTKAIYLYADADYRHWEAVLGTPLTPGTFGENLTVSGPELGEARIGEQFSVGTAVIAVTGPRLPCATLGKRMRDPLFPKTFLAEGRTGLYGRVVETGEVWTGCALERVGQPNLENPTVAEVHELYASKDRRLDALARLRDAPDAPQDWRDWAQRKIGTLEGA